MVSSETCLRYSTRSATTYSGAYRWFKMGMDWVAYTVCTEIRYDGKRVYYGQMVLNTDVYRS